MDCWITRSGWTLPAAAAVVLACSLPLAGCQREVARSEQSAQTLAAPPTASTGVTDEYRIKTEYAGNASNAQFTVAINGIQVGAYNTDADQDIRPFLRPGPNQVTLGWTAAPDMDPDARALLSLGYNRDGAWSDVIKQNVEQNTQAGRKTYTILVGPVSSSASAGPATAPAPAGTTAAPADAVPASLSPSTPAAAPASNLAETYVLKTLFSGTGPTFTVFINGAQVGAFGSNANQDITGLLKKGPNPVKIVWEKDVSGSGFGSAILTIGVNRNSKWYTVIKQEIRSGTPGGSKTYNLVAR